MNIVKTLIVYTLALSWQSSHATPPPTHLQQINEYIAKTRPEYFTYERNVNTIKAEIRATFKDSKQYEQRRKLEEELLNTKERMRRIYGTAVAEFSKNPSEWSNHSLQISPYHEDNIYREMNTIRSGLRMERASNGRTYYLERVPGEDRFVSISEEGLRDMAIRSIQNKQNTPPIVVKTAIPEAIFNTNSALEELLAYRNKLRLAKDSRIDEIVSDDLVKGKKRDKILQKRMLIEREMNKTILELEKLMLAGNNNVDDANKILQKLGNKEWFKTTINSAVENLQKTQGLSWADSKTLYTFSMGFKVLMKTALLAPVFGVYAAYANETQNSQTQSSTKYDSGDAMEPNFRTANK